MVDHAAGVEESRKDAKRAKRHFLHFLHFCAILKKAEKAGRRNRVSESVQMTTFGTTFDRSKTA